MALQASPAVSQALPDALIADPPRDLAHPARLEQLRYPSAGVQIPARLFVAGPSRVPMGISPRQNAPISGP